MFTVPGQLPVTINDAYATTIERFSIDKDRASSVHTGFTGNFAKGEGVFQYTFSFEMPPLVNPDGTGGWQFTASVLKGPFTLSFYIGSQEYRVTGCGVNKKSIQVAMAQGNTSSPFSGNALNCTPEL